MAEPDFVGWVGHDKEAVHGKMVWENFKVKPFEEDDVDVEISHCGICGSDLHVLESNWFPAPYPVVVGHEIVGKVTRKGSNATHLSVGDRVGIGAQVRSCLKEDCPACSRHEEHHCPNDNVMTYGVKFKSGFTAQGGYANMWRGHSHFAIKIPDELPSEQAAPMLCGGITTYSPLKRHGAGPGKSVGIIGIGGLGHFAILWAKALGADKVVAISRTLDKEKETRKLGVDEYIATSEAGWEDKHANSLDLIVETAGPRSSTPYDGYFKLLRPEGTLVQLGNSGQPLPPIKPGPFISRGIKFTGSCIGSPTEITEMLELAAKKQVRAWIETQPMKDANQAIIDFADGKPRYRYCLVN